MVERLGRGLKENLIDRLQHRGMIQPEQRGVRGAFGISRWTARDPRHEDELRGHLDQVLTQAVQPDPRSAAIVGLLNACGQAHRVLGSTTLTPREIKRRAKEIGDGGWAAKAVLDSINATNAAVMAMVASTPAIVSSEEALEGRPQVPASRLAP